MAQDETLTFNEKLSGNLAAINASGLEALVTFLCNESPFKAALIIACSEPKNAARILERIPRHIRQPIIAVLAHGIHVSPEVFERIAADAVEALQRLQSDENRRISVGSMMKCQALMQPLNRRTAKSLLGILKETDNERYNEMRSSIVLFEDIIQLPDHIVQKVLREAEFQDLAAALVTAPEPLKDKMKRNMSKRIAAHLEEAIKMYAGQLSEADSEKMQDRITDIIIRLEKTGEIVIPRNSDRFV
ncbi:MAG: FliG C-terminal domain-containing protein [Treponema sp.]